MIKREFLDDKFVRTYSDLGVYIHGGYPEADYEEAIDPILMNRTYVETCIPIIDWEEPEEMISDRNISSNQYFTIGNNLYYSTQSIALGDNIIIDKNCIKIDIASVLNEIKEAE